MVELFRHETQRLTEALEMDDLPLTQESNHVIYVGIVREPENVIVGGARLLFGGKVLGEIGDRR